MGRRTKTELDTVITDTAMTINELNQQASSPTECTQAILISLLLAQYEILRELRIKNDRDEWKDRDELIRRQMND